MKAMLVSLPSGKPIPFDGELILIGRHKKNDIISDHSYVSGTHCALSRKGAAYFIEDMNSSNGTFVNGVKISRITKLRNNDTISLGQKAVAYQFRLYSGILRSVKEFAGRPLNLVLSVAALVLVLGVLVYFFIIRDWGKIDLKNVLAILETSYGENILHDDLAFLAALEREIKEVKADNSFVDTLARRNYYKDLIERIFKEQNIQPDFSYIAWVESRYNPRAYNQRSGARGMWQLMPDTARQYGLRVDGSADERLDPEKSTRAAALYFKDLISVLGKDSFLLVLAAYNAGDNAVLYGLKQIEDPVKDRNFWYLYTHNLIPPETKRYVLKILAIIILAEYY
jgi:pSer/pThr/pTyr-binding forkhead associated (FHA) protein